MRFDNIFVPKGNGLGWTLNPNNPLSTYLAIAFLLVVFFIYRKRLKNSIFLLMAYFKPAIRKND